MKLTKLFYILPFIVISNILASDSVIKHEEKKEITEKDNIALDIADSYLKSFSDREVKEEITEVRKKFDVKKFFRAVELDEKDQVQVSLTKLMNCPSLHVMQSNMEDIINKNSWKDLKVFYGTTTNASYNLISRINKTNTRMGEAALAILLVSPTSNIEELKERQNIIKLFIKNDKVYNAIGKSLKDFRVVEESLSSFWTKKDPLYNKEYMEYIHKKFYFSNEQTNKSVGSLEFSKRFFRDWWDIFSGPLFSLEVYLGFNIIALFGTNAKQREFTNKEYLPIYVPFYNFFHASKIIKRNIEEDKTAGRTEGSYNFIYMVPVVISAYWVWSVYGSYQKYNEYAAVLSNLANRLDDIQAFLKSAEEINEQILLDPELEKLYGKRLQELRKLLAADKNDPDSEFGRLIHNLKTMKLKSWSYFFNNAGKLLATFKLFLEHKDKFKNAFYEYGNLDAFHSFATLYKEAEKYDTNNNYTFVDYLSRKDQKTPYIEIKDMWNPFLDSKLAVENKVKMDAASGTRTMVLTGPNAGGKSTYVAGVTISVILSQVCGLVPAKSMKVTPFNKINSYIEILDDIAAGKSLFMAEVERAQQHIKMIQDLKDNEFSFTIFDEPFSGTNPLEGSAAEFSILKYLGKYENTLNIVATHYPIVMLLEDREYKMGFRNYKVYIKPREDGTKRINYTYKILRGKSTQAIAIDILEAEGYDTTMLKDARDIIANPQKYISKFK